MEKSIIEKRVDYISKRLEKLKDSLDKYESEEDEDYKYIILKAIERECEEIIESGTKINKMILEDNDIIPENYRDGFISLGEIKLLDTKTAERLANTVGFRNRLAHEYMELNTEIKSAKNILKLYPKYLTKVLDFLHQ